MAGLLTRLLEPKAATPDQFDDYWYGAVEQPTITGINVNADSALKTSAVYACVRVLAEAVASLPLITYKRRDDGGKERWSKHPVYGLLHDRPNRWQTSFEWREMMMGHVLLRGNAYSEIVSGPRGDVDELVPLHPDKVRPELQANGDIKYWVKRTDGSERGVAQDDVFHMRGMSSDGIKGMSVIEYARESIGLSMATEQQAGRSFGQGTSIRGVLTHPSKLPEEAAKRLSQSWNAAYGGTAGAGKTAVLEEGMTWKAVGMNHADAQFVEMRNFQIADIARWFNVPGVMVGVVDKTATYASAEQFFLSFVTNTVRPWLVRWEQRINGDLILATAVYFAEFLVDALLRGDTKTRFEAYQIARQNGWMNGDEIRAKENMNPIEGGMGKIYLQQANTVPLGTEPQQAALPVGRTEAVSSQTHLLAEEAAARLLRKATVAVGKAAVKYADDSDGFRSWCGTFYGKFAGEIAQSLHVSDEAAAEVAQEQRFAVLHHGVGVMATMEQEWAQRLAALALGGEA